MEASGTPSDALEMAIDWMVLLRSGEADDTDSERLRAWCASDTRHAAAWAQVQGAVEVAVSPLRATGEGVRAAAQTALIRPSRRRAIGTSLGMAALGVTVVWLAQRQWPVAVLAADLRTGIGERRGVTLADGSQLELNAGSAVDVDFGPDRRVLRLRAGELIVRVVPDAQRPFTVQTSEGDVLALGTRFLVRQDEGRTLAMVLQHSVLLRPANGIAHTLQVGQAAYFSVDSVGSVQDGLQGASAWERGMLVANDRPLSEVVAALRPYRAGFIRVSPQAARLRVLGAFPLADPDQVLESLAQTLPIQLTHYGGWLLTIDLRS